MSAAERLRKLEAHERALIRLARRAAGVLESSLQRIGGEAEIPQLAGTSAGQDSLESLTARFARLSDLFVQQVFRIRDRLEGLEEGSPLDRLNRAEKRGWIDDVETWREIRELRNRISHEYAEDVWLGMVRDAYRLAPRLLACVARIAAERSMP